MYKRPCRANDYTCAGTVMNYIEDLITIDGILENSVGAEEGYTE
jgi:hypothetical protein